MKHHPSAATTFKPSSRISSNSCLTNFRTHDSSNCRSTCNAPFSGKEQDAVMDGDACRPDLSSCITGLESGNFHSDHPWPFQTGCDQLPLIQERLEHPTHGGASRYNRARPHRIWANEGRKTRVQHRCVRWMEWMSTWGMHMMLMWVILSGIFLICVTCSVQVERDWQLALLQQKISGNLEKLYCLWRWVQWNHNAYRSTLLGVKCTSSVYYTSRVSKVLKNLLHS